LSSWKEAVAKRSKAVVELSESSDDESLDQYESRGCEQASLLGDSGGLDKDNPVSNKADNTESLAGCCNSDSEEVD
jgi:hypothetical protein